MRTSSATSARPRAALIAVAAVALTAAGALAGCSSSSSSGSSSPSGGTAKAADSSKPAGDPHKATVTITSAGGCAADKVSFPAGEVTFDITNKDATAVSEVELQSGQRIVGEKENLPPGFSGTFAVTVDAGTYTLYCPGATKENTPITVTGQASTGADTNTSALLANATKEYASYVTAQIGYLLQTSQALQTALQGTDLTAAQQAYMKARPYYEKIEPVAESFTVGTDTWTATSTLAPTTCRPTSGPASTGSRRACSRTRA